MQPLPLLIYAITMLLHTSTAAHNILFNFTFFVRWFLLIVVAIAIACKPTTMRICSAAKFGSTKWFAFTGSVCITSQNSFLPKKISKHAPRMFVHALRTHRHSSKSICRHKGKATETFFLWSSYQKLSTKLPNCVRIISP